MQTLGLWLLLAFGIVETFAGYRIFRLLVVVVGFLVGWSYAPALVAEATGASLSSAMALLVAILGAMLFGALAWFAFGVLVALFGFAVGYSLGVSAGAEPWLALLVAVVAAVLAVIATRPVIIALTALNGAWITVATTLVLLGIWTQAPPAFFLSPPELPLERPVLLLAVLALAAVGAVVQWRQGYVTVGGTPVRRESW